MASHLRTPVFFILLLLSIGTTALARPQTPEGLNHALSKSLADPAFNSTYTRNGCFARAHWIANELHVAGVAPVKAFIRPMDPAQKIQFTDPKLQTYRWVFHVAAAHLERVSNTEERVWILDPLISTTALTVDEWLASFRNQNPDVELKVSIENAEVYSDRQADNDEFQALGAPFGPEAIDFIRDVMEQLTYWESLDSLN